MPKPSPFMGGYDDLRYAIAESPTTPPTFVPLLAESREEGGLGKEGGRKWEGQDGKDREKSTVTRMRIRRERGDFPPELPASESHEVSGPRILETSKFS